MPRFWTKYWTKFSTRKQGAEGRKNAGNDFAQSGMAQTPTLSEQDKHAGVTIPTRVVRNFGGGVEVELVDGETAIAHISDGLTNQTEMA